MVKSLKSVFS